MGFASSSTGKQDGSLIEHWARNREDLGSNPDLPI